MVPYDEDSLAGQVIFESEQHLVVAFGKTSEPSFEVVDKLRNLVKHAAAGDPLGRYVGAQQRAWVFAQNADPLALPSQEEVDQFLAGVIACGANALCIH